MNKKKLGVNIDHVATVRNARGENYPSPLKAALMAEKNGAGLRHDGRAHQSHRSEGRTIF